MYRRTTVESTGNEFYGALIVKQITPIGIVTTSAIVLRNSNLIESSPSDKTGRLFQKRKSHIIKILLAFLVKCLLMLNEKQKIFLKV